MKEHCSSTLSAENSSMAASVLSPSLTIDLTRHANVWLVFSHVLSVCFSSQGMVLGTPGMT